MHWQAVSCNNNSNNKVNIVAEQPRRCHRWMCCTSCQSCQCCLLDVWMLGQLYWLPSLVRQVHVQAERRERDGEGDGDERGQLGNSFRQASRQSPDDQTTRRSSSQDTIEFMYHFVYLCIIYDLCFNACLHNKLVSSPAPHTPLPSSSFPLLLPPLLCASLQSHIRRTILPIIETSFRRFVSFRSKPITVGQSNCLKSRDLLRSTVTVTVGASTLHNVLPSSPAIHPTACLVIQSSSGFIWMLPVNRRFRQEEKLLFLAHSWPEDRIGYRRSTIGLRKVS